MYYRSTVLQEAKALVGKRLDCARSRLAPLQDLEGMAQARVHCDIATANTRVSSRQAQHDSVGRCWINNGKCRGWLRQQQEKERRNSELSKCSHHYSAVYLGTIKYVSAILHQFLDPTQAALQRLRCR